MGVPANGTGRSSRRRCNARWLDSRRDEGVTSHFRDRDSSFQINKMNPR